MKFNVTPFHMGILVAGLITFNGQELNLLAVSVVTVLALWPKKPENPPAKVYDFAEYKARRDAAKQPKTFKKAA